MEVSRRRPREFEWDDCEEEWQDYPDYPQNRPKRRRRNYASDLDMDYYLDDFMFVGRSTHWDMEVDEEDEVEASTSRAVSRRKRRSATWRHRGRGRGRGRGGVHPMSSRAAQTQATSIGAEEVVATTMEPPVVTHTLVEPVAIIAATSATANVQTNHVVSAATASPALSPHMNHAAAVAPLGNTLPTSPAFTAIPTTVARPLPVTPAIFGLSKSAAASNISAPLASATATSVVPAKMAIEPITTSVPIATKSAADTAAPGVVFRGATVKTTIKAATTVQSNANVPAVTALPPKPPILRATAVATPNPVTSSSTQPTKPIVSILKKIPIHDVAVVNSHGSNSTPTTASAPMPPSQQTVVVPRVQQSIQPIISVRTSTPSPVIKVSVPKVNKIGSSPVIPSSNPTVARSTTLPSPPPVANEPHVEAPPSINWQERYEELRREYYKLKEKREKERNDVIYLSGKLKAVEDMNQKLVERLSALQPQPQA